jgi:hypothetical protein
MGSIINWPVPNICSSSSSAMNVTALANPFVEREALRGSEGTQHDVMLRHLHLQHLQQQQQLKQAHQEQLRLLQTLQQQQQQGNEFCTAPVVRDLHGMQAIANPAAAAAARGEVLETEAHLPVAKDLLLADMSDQGQMLQMTSQLQLVHKAQPQDSLWGSIGFGTGAVGQVVTASAMAGPVTSVTSDTTRRDQSEASVSDNRNVTGWLKQLSEVLRALGPERAADIAAAASSVAAQKTSSAAAAAAACAAAPSSTSSSYNTAKASARRY